MENRLINLQEFKREFGTEKQCHDYLFNLRWSGGYRCPICDCDKKWDLKNFKYKCYSCGYQTTATAGTMFHGAHIPLNLWFNAIWYVISQTQVTSALGLQKELGLRSNNTALDMLYNIRRTMYKFEQDKLQGDVAVEKISYAGNDVLIAVEINENGNNRIRMSVGSILGFIKRNIELGSTIINNGSSGYNVYGMGYTSKIIISKIYYFNKRYQKMLPPIYTVISKLKKQGLLGRLQCFNSKKINIQTHHVAYYLVECCFKYNRQNSKEIWFDEILKSTLNTKRISYKKTQDKGHDIKSPTNSDIFRA